VISLPRISTQAKAIDQTQREQRNLTKMLLRELITAEEFKKTRAELQGKIRDLRKQGEETDYRVNSWLDLTERAFNFTVNARENFNLGDMRSRKEIFSALGQNFLMKDGKLTISKHDWLIPIEESYPALEVAYRRLEPKESPENKGRTEALASVHQKWLPILLSSENLQIHLRYSAPKLKG
jgi:hypothetical protein